MRKLMLAALLLFSVGAFSQINVVESKRVTAFEKLEAKDKFFLRGYRVDSISNDTLFTSNSVFNLPTQFAVTNYVARMIRTNTASSLPWTNITGIPTANGTTNGILLSSDYNGFNGKQAALNGTGFVKASGTTISYDNSTYLSTSSATSTYFPLSGGNLSTGSFLGLPKLSTAPATPASGYVSFFADSLSRFGYVNASGYYRIYSMRYPDNQLWYFPYKSGGGILVDSADLVTLLATKQTTLISGTNIKTVNSGSLLGSGNLAVGDALVANPLSQFASTTSAQLASNLTNETGSGLAMFNSNPTIADSMIAPIISGGTATTSTLTLKATTGVGTTGSDILFKVGNNGGTTAMRAFNDGTVGVGYNTVQGYNFSVNGSGLFNGALQLSGASSDIGGARNIVATNNITSGLECKNTNSSVTTSMYTSSSMGTVGTTTNHTLNVVSNGTARASFFTNGNVAIGSTTDNSNGKLQLSGNLALETAGNKMLIATGTNASSGTATLSSGTVTVSTTAVTASSLIFLTHAGSSVVSVGTLSIGTKTAATSFVINSSNVADSDTVNWFIIN